ncbi:Acyl-CoA dehydrogenase [compost metagenome]
MNTLQSFSLVAIPPEDEALRAPVRAFLQSALHGVAPAVRARSWMGFDADFSRALGRQGWIGLTLPKAYGGAGRSSFARFVLLEELLAAGAPVSAHWIADRQTAPLILRYGSEAQRAFFVPRIARGELFTSIGMSEPDTGSDLAGVRSRAVLTATGWRLNGRKIWTTNAHRAHYMCTLVRTSGMPEDRHKGLSQLLVDLTLLFEDVELPADALVGEEGAGWQQVTAELAFERSGPERIYSSLVLAEAWLAELRQGPAPAAGAQVIAGRIAARMAVLRAMSLAVAEQLGRGLDPAFEASLVKDLGTEFEQAVPGWIEEAFDAPGHPVPSAGLLQTLAYVTQLAPSFSLRGGTRQIMRGIIARGLGVR